MLLIYLPAITPRSEYIFEQIFNNQLGINYHTTTSIKVFKDYAEEKINYSGNRHKDEFHIKACPLLLEDDIREMPVYIEQKSSLTILFSNDDSCDVGFDIFSATFYMLSRYEEYLPFTPDEHGRFQAAESLAYKNNFVQVPVVDKWLRHFKSILKAKFPGLKIRDHHFSAIVTYDIDVAYKFKGRSFKRNAGATLKDLLRLDLENTRQRFKTLFNKRKDPWDVYDYLRDKIGQHKLRSIFFFLLGDISKHDRNLHHGSKAMKDLVDTVKTFSDIGIHPSYKTLTVPEEIIKEKERLEKLSGESIHKSRQHYLRFTLPDTYNYLIEAGIHEDYSMGFPGVPGFRAGTSRPFYFYDLKMERSTKLKLFPVTMMEGAFIDLKHPEPQKAAAEIVNLVEAVKDVNGTFISIWHNHTISKTKEYVMWRNVHEQMIRKIVSCF